jgi:fructokinase
MRKIYGIGEALLDVIFKNNQPQAAKAGGSVLNSAVSMGRMGLPVSFISEYGKDDIGNIIDEFLTSNGVDTSSVYKFKDGNTTLAMAFLNEKNDASYTFYQKFPTKRLDIEFPVINKEDIVQCGSFFAIWSEIRDKFKKFIKQAYDNGALVLYDPNFRKSHVSELNVLKPLVLENMKMTSLLRGSDEDFKNIFGARSADEAWNIVKQYVRCMVYTANVEGVYVRTTSFAGKFPVKNITPVSTIGAGDNFNAGMITAIHKNNYLRDQLPLLGEKEWTKIISSAVEFASHVCMSYDNYISEEFAETMKKTY